MGVGKCLDPYFARFRETIWSPIVSTIPGMRTARVREAPMEADVILTTFLSTLGDMVARGWDNFTARPQGPASFRFVVQPLVGLVLAIRAGLKDAKAGRRAFLWAALTDPAARGELLRSSWKDLRTPFFVAATIDAIYQTIVHQAIYLFELLFTATLLGVVPYALLRGPANRIARLRGRGER